MDWVILGVAGLLECFWATFMKLSEGAEEDFLKEQRTEIQERIQQLIEPEKIEAGINQILTGHPEFGITALEPYIGGNYDQWWPLHYYLGAAYAELEQVDKAIERYLRVLQLNPSHAESMKELADLYDAKGDAVMGEKYRNKIKLVKEN